MDVPFSFALTPKPVDFFFKAFQEPAAFATSALAEYRL